MPVKQTDNPVEEFLAGKPVQPLAGEVVIGEFRGLSAGGQALVDFAQNPTAVPLVAVSTQPVKQSQKGRQVALMFANGDLQQPLLLGFIHSPLEEMLESFEFSAVEPAPAEVGEAEDTELPAQKDFADNVTVDGKKITFEAAEEIVLRCGNASITLTRAGKILIRGAYLLNRSSGVNRIVGGSVQVN